MQRIRDDVHLICTFPPHTINCYLAGDVLIDAMRRGDARRILRSLHGHEVRAHALTHAHPDHQGATHEVCDKLGIPLWVGEADVAAAEDPRLIGEGQPSHPINTIFRKLWMGPGHPVDRILREGDEVAGFTVIDTPGHSPGHVAFWRESDRTLIAGDVLNNQHPLLRYPRGPREPLGIFTPDPARNRESIRRLGELEPDVVLVGHGPPLDGARFTRFARAL